MTCPGCGGVLAPVSAIGFDDSYRCGTCGGMWVANWVVNTIADGKLLQVKSMGKQGAPLGTYVCPRDGIRLAPVDPQSAPEALHTLSCPKCGWWWFRADTLMEFARAELVKKDYLYTWRNSVAARFTLPALVVLVSLMGVIGGVQLVQMRQRAAIEARISVTELIVTPEPNDWVISFKSKQPVAMVEIKGVNDMSYKTYTDVQFDGQRYSVRVTGLVTGAYVARINGEEVPFSIVSYQAR